MRKEIWFRLRNPEARSEALSGPGTAQLSFIDLGPKRVGMGYTQAPHLPPIFGKSQGKDWGAVKGNTLATH